MSPPGEPVSWLTARKQMPITWQREQRSQPQSFLPAMASHRRRTWSGCVPRALGVLGFTCCVHRQEHISVSQLALCPNIVPNRPPLHGAGTMLLEAAAISHSGQKCPRSICAEQLLGFTSMPTKPQRLACVSMEMTQTSAYRAP